MTDRYFTSLYRRPHSPDLYFLSSITYSITPSFGTGIGIGELNSSYSGKEFVVGTGRVVGSVEQGEVYCYSSQNQLLWTYTAPNHCSIMAVEIGDIDEDGTNEVAVGFQAGGDRGISLLTNTGSLLWHVDTGGYCRSIKIAKMRNDYSNKQAVISGYTGVPGQGFLKLLDQDGNQIWSKTIPTPAGGWNQTVQGIGIVDADNDGQNEIYVAQDRYAHKYDHLGNLVWSKQVSTAPGVFGNACYGIDAGVWNNQKVAAIVSQTSGLTVLDGDGNTILVVPIQYAEAVKIGDANNDGENEIVVSWCTDPWIEYSPSGLKVIDSNGSISSSVSLNSESPYVNIGDVNNDGRNEIVATSHTDGIFIFRCI